MRVFDQGSGPAVVVIPGVQGRWEWARPALRQLASRCRTISYSLCGDIGSGQLLRQGGALDDYLQQLDRVLDAAGIERAAVCGVSFGGVVAVHYAATRPQRVSALILASTPGPGWQPNPQQARWIARPWRSAPAFVLTSPLRLWPELSAAFPALGERLGFMARQGVRCLASPMIPPLVAARTRAAAAIDLEAAGRGVTAPTLIVSGEEELDRVVPVPTTRAYASIIPGAEYRVVRRTGHLGLLTQPSVFAEIVSGFVHAHHH